MSNQLNARMLSLSDLKTDRPDAFYLVLTIAGYLTLSIVLYCFGQFFIAGSVNCDVPECWDPRYAHNPTAFLLLIPGLILGLMGVIQLRLDGNHSAKANRRMLRRSFQCNALAVMGLCIGIGLNGTDSSYIAVIRLVIASASLALFIAGVLLSLINITWNLVGRLTSKDRASLPAP